MDKNVKAMLKISDVLDDRYQKLCDRYHNLELSHNRKKRALEKIALILGPMLALYEACPEIKSMDRIIVLGIQSLIDNALFCDGRERSKR